MYKLDEDRLQFLILQIKNSDSVAFREYFNIFYPSIVNFVFRYTGKKEIAKDIAQDTFIKFWNNRYNLKVDCNCKAYLFRIARNTAFTYLERNNFLIEYFEDDRIYVSENRLEMPESFFLNDYQKAINNLPERCKATFLLSREGGFSYKEISEIMGVEIQTVKNQINKALSTLKVLLREYLD